MYQNAYKYKKKKKSRKSKFKIAALVMVVLILAFVFYYFYVVSPIICSLSEEKIRSLSTTCISQSVSLAMNEKNLTYDDLVHISYSNDNEISLIQTDTIEINKLVRRVTELVQLEMDTLGKEGIQIALGTFTGIPFLFGLGPMIDLKLVPVGTVNTDFNSKFEKAGINQTRHTLNFKISANVGMILPSSTRNFTTMLEVVICESVIIGKVPSVYFNGGVGELV